MAVIYIRDVSDEVVRHIDNEALRQGLSRQQFILNMLDTFTNPPMVVGYVECDRQGEFEVCPECGQTIQYAWIQFFSNNTFNLVCNFCATSE